MAKVRRTSDVQSLKAKVKYGVCWKTVILNYACPYLIPLIEIVVTCFTKITQNSVTFG